MLLISESGRLGGRSRCLWYDHRRMRNRTLSLHVAIYLVTRALASVALSQDAGDDHTAVPILFQQMMGTWHVQQRMWPAADKEPVNFPPAVAKRRLVAGAILEESMESAPGDKAHPFTRIAYFNYNAVSQRFEYFSIDSRAPQMMMEKSRAGVVASPTDGGAILFYGGKFVAPQWGDATNIAFNYRVTVGEIEKDRQVVQIFFTPSDTAGSKEFLAFEYVYMAQR